MELIRGIIKTTDSEYNSAENSFTINHIYGDIFCAPYNFSIKNESGYESIEVADVEYYSGRIKVYFGSLDISDKDEIAYAFSIVIKENSNSDSFSWNSLDS
jgi:hypothetical protein